MLSIFGRKYVKYIGKAVIWSAVILSYILFYATYVLVDRFGRDILPAIVFHIKYPLWNVSFSPWIMPVIIGLSCLPLLIFGLYAIWNPNRFKADFVYPLYYKFWRYFIFLVCFMGNILYINSELDVRTFIEKQFQKSTLMDRNYVYQKALIKPDSRNLVVILLESMEWTYADKNIMGRNLIPNLMQIATENIPLKGYRSMQTSSWTTAAYVNLFCGVPLKENSNKKKYTPKETIFLPKLTCWSEDLSEQGVYSVFMTGTSLLFGGKYAFLKSHGFHELWDMTNYPWASHAKIGTWGLRDGESLMAARDKITQIAHTHSRWLFAIETVDMHAESYYPHFQDTVFWDIRDTIMQTDRQVSDFIRWLQKQPFYSQTTVVVIGDHPLMLDQDLDKHVPQFYRVPNREVFATVLNSVQGNPVPHEWTMFDMAPTILEAAGFEVQNGKYGLGRSLWRSARTMVEIYGHDLLEDELSKKSELYNSFDY